MPAHHRTSPSPRRAQALDRRDSVVRSAYIITAPTVADASDALCCPACGHEFIWLAAINKDHEHTGLEFRCEACPSVSVLVLVQRAGQVFPRWY